MRKVFGILIFLFLTVFNASAFAGDDVVLAKIGDKKITLSDFNRIMGYYDADKQKMLEQNPAFKATIFQRIVQAAVLSKIARENGFDKRADIGEQIDLLLNDFLATEYLKKTIVGKIDVSENDMSLYYKAHQEEFTTPETVRVRHILIKVDKSASDETKKKAKGRAEEILKKIKSGEDFAKLASEFSDDPGSKENGGDIGFFQRGKMIPDFEKVVFSLKPGEISGVFETPLGFHIAKVEERKKAVIEPYDKVKDQVRVKVFAEFRKARVDEFVKKAMKDANAEMNLDPLLPKK